MKRRPARLVSTCLAMFLALGIFGTGTRGQEAAPRLQPSKEWGVIGRTGVPCPERANQNADQRADPRPQFAKVLRRQDEKGVAREHAGKMGTSPGKAMLLSFLVPGLGQHKADSRISARVFFAAEAALWLGYASFRTSARWHEESYHLFARVHAGIDPEGKDKQFYINIENYSSIDEYNQAKLRERNLKDYYRDREKFYWRWDSPENRRLYESIRVKSDQAYNRAELTVGGILANHLISALHALWVTRRKSGTEHAASRWDWYGQVSPTPRLTVSARF